MPENQPQPNYKYATSNFLLTFATISYVMYWQIQDKSDTCFFVLAIAFVILGLGCMMCKYLGPD